MQHYYHYHHIHCCDNWSTKYHHENTDVPLKLEKNRSLLSLITNMVCLQCAPAKNHKEVEGSTKNPRREFFQDSSSGSFNNIFSILQIARVALPLFARSLGWLGPFYTSKWCLEDVLHLLLQESLELLHFISSVESSFQ